MVTLRNRHSATHQISNTAADNLLFSHGIIERAFGLTSCGRFQEIRELEKALGREGFPNVVERLSGPSLRTRLRKLMDRRP
jgi:hypothetical protein